MTIDVPTATIVGGAVAALAAGIGWVARTTVFGRFDALEKSRDKLGVRVGDLESWIKAHDAVDAYRYRRKLTSGQGIPTQEDDTPP